MSTFHSTFSCNNIINAAFETSQLNAGFNNQRLYGTTKILYFNTHFDFPSIGNSQYLYIAKNEQWTAYVYDSDMVIYRVMGLGAEDIAYISGGESDTQYLTPDE